MAHPVYTALPNRAAITISGADKTTFIQGLITQDIQKLDDHPLIYACLLTAQGKFLYDFFIRKGVVDGNDVYILDCEGGDRATSLLKKLRMYKLRSQVDLSLSDNLFVAQIFSGDIDPLPQVESQAECYADPRHALCGYRAYAKPTNIDEAPFDTWDAHRIRADIPDGSRDLIPEKSFIHEGRLDELNAVSYSKGCYMGQELVSRMHHRGLAKKHLKCVDLNAVPDDAEIRSRCDHAGVGLALVRIS